MTTLRSITITIFSGLLLLCAAGEASAQGTTFDIGSGGLPTITGALGGAVTGTADVTQSLVVTINFGELSPANTNGIVKVVVPISIRSDSDYQVAVSLTASTFDANPQAVQRSDIGFGANNIRQLGAKAFSCTNHIFRAPFNNDPATSVTLDVNGRAAYPSSLANIGGSTVILSGPKLTKGTLTKRETTNGYAFDAIFAIRPQYYVSGSFNVTLTFTISAGPSVPCL